MRPVAPTLDAHYGDKLGLDNQHINAGGGCSSVSKTIITKMRLDAETETLIPTIGGGFDVAFPIDTQSMTENHASGGNGFGECGDQSFTLTKGHSHAVAFKIRSGCEGGGKGYLGSKESAFTLSTTHDQDIFTPQMQVRRLTPIECARLQGFHDDYLTQVPGYSDSAAYRALGNSMAVNVMQLIGQRIQMVSEIPQAQEIAA